MHLEQHKLKQVFHPSTKVKSQPSFFPGNAWRSPQFILDVLGRAFPGGWLGARVLPVVSRTDLQTWTHVLLPTLCHPTMYQLPAFLASPGIVACIPWKSHSLGCRSNPQCTKNMKMREEQIQLLPAPLTFCVIHRPGRACKSWTANPSFTEISLAHCLQEVRDTQRDCVWTSKPSRMGWRAVDSVLKPAMCLACQIYASPIGFPAHTAMECTQDVHSCPICSARVGCPNPRDVCT